MKNIVVNITFLMSLFTFIGCDNLPVQPITDDSTSYSIIQNNLNDEETMSSVGVNNGEVPLDSILLCFNLTPEQKSSIDSAISRYKWVQESVKWGKVRELDIRKQAWDSLFKSMNLQPTDSNYTHWKKEYNFDMKQVLKKFSDSLSTYKRMTHRRIFNELNEEQKVMFSKWQQNPKLTCEFLKP